MERKITTENACAEKIDGYTIKYLIRPETYDGTTLLASLVKERSSYYEADDKEDRKETSKVLFTKPIEKFPHAWLKGIKISLDFSFYDGELSSGYHFHELQSEHYRRELRPIIDEQGRYVGCDEYACRSKYRPDKNDKSKEVFEKQVKTATYTPEQEPRGITMLVHVQGDRNIKERRLASQKIRERAGFTIEKKLWVIPVYVNGHFLGAKLEYDLNRGGGSMHYGMNVISPEEFMTLPEHTPSPEDYIY